MDAVGAFDEKVALSLITIATQEPTLTPTGAANAWFLEHGDSATATGPGADFINMMMRKLPYSRPGRLRPFDAANRWLHEHGGLRDGP
jgi:hypothetical protein